MFKVNRTFPRSVPQFRSLFGALVGIFNAVSKERIQAVGPDRACAEWLMRNGAFVRWKGQTEFVGHYNNLPLDEKDTSSYCIEEVDATDSGISHHGFPHFKDCNYITKIRLQNCIHIDDTALSKLDFLENVLCHLYIIRCHAVTDSGIESLGKLKALRYLKLGQLSNVKDTQKCMEVLHKAIPQCVVRLA